MYKGVSYIRVCERKLIIRFINNINKIVWYFVLERTLKTEEAAVWERCDLNKEKKLLVSGTLVPHSAGGDMFSDGNWPASYKIIRAAKEGRHKRLEFVYDEEMTFVWKCVQAARLKRAEKNTQQRTSSSIQPQDTDQAGDMLQLFLTRHELEPESDRKTCVQHEIRTVHVWTLYLYLQQWFENRQVKGEAALLDVTAS